MRQGGGAVDGLPLFLSRRLPWQFEESRVAGRRNIFGGRRRRAPRDGFIDPSGEVVGLGNERKVKSETPVEHGEECRAKGDVDPRCVRSELIKRLAAEK